MSSTIECPVAERCGGCPLIGSSQQAQQALKEKAVREALRRAGVDWQHELSWTAAAPRSYRNRIRLKLDQGRLQFFNPQKHADCAVLEHGLQRVLAVLHPWALEHRALLQSFSHLEARSPDADGVWGLELAPGSAELPEQRAADVWRALSALQSCAAWICDRGSPPEQRFALSDDCHCYVPIGSFMQINHAVNRKLIERLTQGVLVRGVHSLIDLYCGSGNLCLPLLIRAGGAMAARGVEIDPHAIAALHHSLRDQGIEAGLFSVDDAASYAKQLVREGLRADLVIADPPRAGLRGASELIVRAASRWIVLCHCSLAAFSRDLASLLQLGCELESVEAFDMFPQTTHLETLTWLAVPAH